MQLNAPSHTSPLSAMLFTTCNLLSELWRGVDKGTVREHGITMGCNTVVEEPLISLSTPFSPSPTLPIWPFPITANFSSIGLQTKKNQPSSQLRLVLAKLAGLGDGRRSNVSALIFPLYLSRPDNVNPLMKLLCACPKPLSSRGNFLFSFRHALSSVMSAPVMATSLCLLSLFPFSFSALSLFSILVSFSLST